MTVRLLEIPEFFTIWKQTLSWICVPKMWMEAEKIECCLCNPKMNIDSTAGRLKDWQKAYMTGFISCIVYVISGVWHCSQSRRPFVETRQPEKDTANGAFRWWKLKISDNSLTVPEGVAEWNASFGHKPSLKSPCACPPPVLLSHVFLPCAVVCWLLTS